jgi:hypothetical protein
MQKWVVHVLGPVDEMAILVHFSHIRVGRSGMDGLGREGIQLFLFHLVDIVHHLSIDFMIA